MTDQDRHHRARATIPVMRAHLRLIETEFKRLEKSPAIPAELKPALSYMAELMAMLVDELAVYR